MARLTRAFTIDSQTQLQLETEFELARREGLPRQLKPTSALDANGLMPEDYKILYDILETPERKRLVAPTPEQYDELVRSCLFINGTQAKATTHFETLKRLRRINKRKHQEATVPIFLNSSRFVEILLNLGLAEYKKLKAAPHPIEKPPKKPTAFVNKWAAFNKSAPVKTATEAATTGATQFKTSSEHKGMGKKRGKDKLEGRTASDARKTEGQPVNGEARKSA